MTQLRRYSPEGPHPLDAVMVSVEDLILLEKQVASVNELKQRMDAAEKKVATCDALMDAMSEVTNAMSQIPQDIKGLTQVKAWIENWMKPSLRKLADLTNAGL